MLDGHQSSNDTDQRRICRNTKLAPETPAQRLSVRKGGEVEAERNNTNFVWGGDVVAEQLIAQAIADGQDGGGNQGSQPFKDQEKLWGKRAKIAVKDVAVKGMDDDRDTGQPGGETTHESSFGGVGGDNMGPDRKSTRLNSSHQLISYAVFCLKK